MASKYAAVLGSLDRDVSTDPTRQDELNQAKAEFATLTTAPELASAYADLRAIKDRIDEELSGVNLRIEALGQLIEATFEHQGVDSVRLTSGATVSVQPEPYTRVEDRDVNRAWAIANGFERLLGLPWQTLNSIAKERLLEGEPPPDGTRLTVRNKIVLRKGKS